MKCFIPQLGHMLWYLYDCGNEIITIPIGDGDLWVKLDLEQRNQGEPLLIVLTLHHTYYEPNRLGIIKMDQSMAIELHKILSKSLNVSHGYAVGSLKLRKSETQDFLPSPGTRLW